MRNTLGRTCCLLEVFNLLIDPLQMRFNAFPRTGCGGQHGQSLAHFQGGGDRIVIHCFEK